VGSLIWVFVIQSILGLVARTLTAMSRPG
jgi:hypothetical protein